MRSQSPDPLLMALDFLGRFHGRPVNLAGAVHGLPISNGSLAPEHFERAAERCGFATQLVRRPLRQIHASTLPVVLLLENDAVILLGFRDNETAEIVFPASGDDVHTVTLDELGHYYAGYAFLAKPTYETEKRTKCTEEKPARNWFWGTLWKFRGFYARVALATVMINILALSSSLFILNVYDRVVPNDAIDTLFALAGGVIIAFVMEFCLKSLRAYFVDRAGHRIDLILGGDLFARILGLPFSAKPASSGALASQARSYEALREFFTSASVSALVDLPFVFLFAGIVYLLGGVVALPLVAGALFALLIGALIQFPISASVSSSYTAGNQRQALLVESVNALETVKATRSESELQARMEENIHVSAKADGNSRFFSQLALNSTSLLQQMVTVGIVIVAFYQVREKEMTMGAMMACVILAGRAMAPMTMISSLLTRLQQSRRALRGLNEIMESPTEREDRGAGYINIRDFRPSIRAHSVHFSYQPEADPVLNGIELKIEPGERVAILGSIGSGKSTFLRMLPGLYFPANGRIDISGIDTRQLDPADLRGHIGYVQQDPALLFGTLRSNLKTGCPGASDDAIWQALERTGLTDFVRSLPRGIDHPVAEGGRSLSGGQRQALSLARALLEDPELLVLDEPTAAMDWSSEQNVLAQLHEYLNTDSERTLVVATHRRSILALVNRVIVLDRGVVIADGPKDQVLFQHSPQQPVAQPSGTPVRPSHAGLNSEQQEVA